MGRILEAHGLRADRRAMPVLRVGEFYLDEGEFLSLVGPNGSGKTTLILALLRLIPLREGTVLFRGKEIGRISPAHRYRRSFAAVFQDALLLNTTVYENVAEGLRIRRTGRRETDLAVMKNLERFGISHLKSRNAARLSGGESQRVSLARAFALSPEILFLDEPFAALDAPTKETVIRDFETALKESPAAVIMATHDMGEALRLSRRVAVMREGSILQTGVPEELMRRPADEFAAAFFGYETILSGIVSGTFDGSFTVSVNGRTVEIAGEAGAGSLVTFSISPENIMLSGGPVGTVSARNTFQGRIERIILAGFYYRVRVDCGFPLVSYITGHSMELMKLREGGEIYATFKSTAVHVLQVR